MTTNRVRFNHVLAFEVSKAKLVVYSTADRACVTIANDRGSIRRMGTATTSRFAF